LVNHSYGDPHVSQHVPMLRLHIYGTDWPVGFAKCDYQPFTDFRPTAFLLTVNSLSDWILCRNYFWKPLRGNSSSDPHIVRTQLVVFPPPHPTTPWLEPVAELLSLSLPTLIIHVIAFRCRTKDCCDLPHSTHIDVLDPAMDLLKWETNCFSGSSLHCCGNWGLITGHFFTTHTFTCVAFQASVVPCSTGARAVTTGKAVSVYGLRCRGSILVYRQSLAFSPHALELHIF
jgi:hypothetical protein